MEPTDSRNAINVADLAAVLRRRALVLLAAIVVTAAAAYLFSRSQTPRYEATASVLTTDQGFAQSALGTTNSGTDPRRQGETNLALARQPAIADAAAAQMPEADVSGADLRAKVEVTAGEFTDIIDFAASDSDPNRTASIANVFAAAYISSERATRRRQLSAARADLTAQLDELENQTSSRANDLRRALADRLSTLETLNAVRRTTPRVAQEASVPSSPVSPRPRRNGIIGAGLGLFLGLGLVALFEQLDRRIRSVEQLEQAYGVPLLGAVPHLPARARLGKAGAVPDPGKLPPHAVEAFRRIRASLRYFNVERPVRSIVIVSALEGEGKSTVAWHLAGADPTERAVLIDADLRDPSISARNGSGPPGGLSDYLAGTNTTPLQPHRPSETSSVVLVPAGPQPPNPTSLLKASRMQSLVEQAADEHELTVIDTPALGRVADALPLLSYSTGVVIVARPGKSRRDAAARLRAVLERANAPVLGLVANDVPDRAGQY